MGRCVKILSRFVDILYPRRCPVCHDIAMPEGCSICESCLDKISFVKSPTCMQCGKHIEDERDELCMDCSERPKSYNYGFALCNYDDIIKQAMIKIKYKNKLEYIPVFADLIVKRYAGQIRRIAPDALVPVPVHRDRLRKRGYNQAEELAKCIADRLGLRVISDMLKRNKSTLAQKELSPDERLKNLSQAFSGYRRYKDIRSVLLVDDIYTTGSTIEACTRTLHGMGVEQVYYVAICIGQGL